MKRVIGMLGLLLVGIGCGDDDESPTSSTLDRLNVRGFPLAVGNTWIYELNGSQSSPDSSAGLNYTWKVAVGWEIAAQDTVLDQQAFRLEITHRFLEGPDQGLVSTGETWFAMEGDTLRSVASRGISDLSVFGQLWKPVVQHQEEQPDEWDVISLIFPLVEGKTWTFLDLWDNDHKSVVKRGEQVVVPAGEFDTFLVARTVGDDSYRTEQWFAEIGLVKLLHRDTQRHTGERGEDLGEFFTTVEMELQSYSLP